MPPERELGRIRKAILEIEDHGCLIFCLDIEFESGLCQDFTATMSGSFTEACIRGVMSAVGVSRWTDLSGQVVWVRRENGLIVEIEAPRYVRRGAAFNVRDVARQFFPPEGVSK